MIDFEREMSMPFEERQQYPSGAHVAPGSFGVLKAIDDREPDCHRWLADNPARPLNLASRRIYFDQTGRRDEFISRYGFAIPTRAALDAIARAAPQGVLEVGAGLGYWSYLLQSLCVDVVCTDVAPVEDGLNQYFIAGPGGRGEATGVQPRSWMDVQKMPAVEAVQMHQERALLSVWPSYKEAFAADALRAYRGGTVVYVGEGAGGCTADDDFHAQLDSDWTPQHVVADVIRFPYLHDTLQIFRRNR